jgi:4-amino-4-deoxy-L-arabinose transferase-like glycosyltransferase
MGSLVRGEGGESPRITGRTDPVNRVLRYHPAGLKDDRATPSSGAGSLLLPVLLVLAALLRAWNGWFASLKLDDFHSIHHARAAGVSAFFEVLLQDNHPPLSFLLVKACRWLFGEAEMALRLPALLAGLGAVGLTWRMARRMEAGPRALATALVAVSSLHIDLSSDVRMYALLALAVAGLLDGLLDLIEEGRGTVRIVLWTFVGLHAHYHFLYPLALLVPCAWLLAPDRRGSLFRALVGAGVLALPWYALGFPTQLGHGLAPGGSHTSPAVLAEGLFHLVFWNISVAGPAWRWVFLLSGLLLGGLVVLGIAEAWRGPRASRVRLVLLLSVALGAPVLSMASALASARAGFEWRYLIGSVVPVALLAAGGDSRPALARLRTGLLGLVTVVATILASFNALDPGEEDYRGAIAALLEQSRAGDAVVAADRQPRLFPHSLAWDYYSRRLARGRPIPEALPFDDGFALTDPGALEGFPRVWCVLRSMNDGCTLLRQLRRRYPTEVREVFGRAIWLHRFEQP